MVNGIRSPRTTRLALVLAVAAIMVIALILRLVNLDALPGETYGDIVIIYDYIAAILVGKWPINFVLSAGPLYQYLVTPVIWLTGLNYLGIKIASVVVSLFVLGATFLLAEELDGPDFAALAMFVAAVSSWLLIFSRLGNSQILVPLLTCGATWLAVRVARFGRRRDLLACAIVSSLGLYTYPQNFILPGVMFATLVALWLLNGGIPWRAAALFLVVSVLFALPFGVLVLRDPGNFFTGYIGEKLPTSDLLPIVLRNIGNGLLALHWKGDVVFRSNVANEPQLDVLSGLLMLIGIVYWCMPARRRLAPALLVPLLLLQVPSLLVRYPIQVPSASRTLGIVPMVYILVASGLWWILVSAQRWRGLAFGLLVVALGLIAALNAQTYFVRYADGLPSHNHPFDRLIARYIDTLPPETTVLVRGCCWALWAQPQSKGIQYALTGPQQVILSEPKDVTCPRLLALPRPAVVVWDPGDEAFAQQLSACTGAPPPRTYDTDRGDPVFQTTALP